MEQRKSILVVEDEIIVARDIQKRLETLGYDASATAATADDAINLAKSENPDLILMDIMLKGDKDGIYAAEVINSSQKIPVIFLTANSDSATIERAKYTDAYGYLLKPFDDRELLSSIEMTLYKYQLNREIEDNRHWYESMLKSIGEAVVSIDRDGNVNFLNSTAQLILGVNNDDILGQTVSSYIKLYDENSLKQIDSMIDQSGLEGQFGDVLELLLETASGERIPVDFSARTIADEAKNDLGVVLTFRDVRERKLAEEEIKEANSKLAKQKDGLLNANERMRSLFKKLEEKNSELQKLDKLKSEFISTVSHELRTPLTIIREGVSLVNDRILGDINETQEDMLKDIIESTDRLGKIINDLLDISKLESGKLDLFRKQINTCELVDRLIKDFSLKAKKNEINLELNCVEDVYPIYADFDRMYQVMSNLVNNAIKFTPASGSVTIEVVNGKKDVAISVVDTGKGIAEADQAKLFDKFSQFGRTAGPGEKGTGLGLSIAKSLVEMHDGSIGVSSELGNGTKFTCKIPRYLDPEERALKSFKDLVQKFKEEDKRSSDFVGVVLIQISNSSDLMSHESDEHIESFMHKVEQTIKASLYKNKDICLSLELGEFAVFLPDTNYTGSCVVASKIKEKLLASGLETNLMHVSPEFSCGVLEYDINDSEEDKVLQRSRSVMKRKKKILIVDDHPQVVRLLSYRLNKEERYECHGVFSGSEAMSFVHEEVPDLIILDIMMPEMSGYEVVGRLKEDKRWRDIPIVLLTAMAVDTQDITTPLPGSIPVVSKTEGFRNLMQIIDSL